MLLASGEGIAWASSRIAASSPAVRSVSPPLNSSRTGGGRGAWLACWGGTMVTGGGRAGCAVGNGGGGVAGGGGGGGGAGGGVGNGGGGGGGAAEGAGEPCAPAPTEDVAGGTAPPPAGFFAGAATTPLFAPAGASGPLVRDTLGRAEGTGATTG